MADSLREQLIAAGLASAKQEKPKHQPRKSTDIRKRGAGKSTAKKPSKGTRHAASNPGSARKPPPQEAASNKSKAKQQEAAAAEAIAEKKRLKAQIKTLIDDNKIEKWQGEIAYRYQVGARLREMYVTEALRDRLAAREVAITRLNGSTYLIPVAIALQISEINPLWTVFNTGQDKTDQPAGTEVDKDYEGYDVPDDLSW